MKAFIIFTIVLTVAYVIYYTVIIVQDLYGKKGEEKSGAEEFTIEPTGDEESISVSESESGFAVGDNEYETEADKPTEEEPATQPSLEETQEQKKEKLNERLAEVGGRFTYCPTTFSNQMNDVEMGNYMVSLQKPKQDVPVDVVSVNDHA